jgi:hypothetical protein
MGRELEPGSDITVQELVVAGMVKWRGPRIEITDTGRETLREKTVGTIAGCFKWLTDRSSNQDIC